MLYKYNCFSKLNYLNCFDTLLQNYIHKQNRKVFFKQEDYLDEIKSNLC